MAQKDLIAEKSSTAEFIFWIACVHAYISVCGSKGAGQECTSSSLGYFSH